MSAQSFADDFIIDQSLKIELIDIGEPSELTDKLLHVLLDVFNDLGTFACHGETTHIIVLYDNGEIAGGALLRVSMRVKRYSAMKSYINNTLSPLWRQKVDDHYVCKDYIMFSCKYILHQVLS